MPKFKISSLFLLLFALFAAGIAAFGTEVKPASPDEIDLDRVDKLADAVRIFNPSDLKRVARAFKNTPDGRAAFIELAASTAKMAKNNDFSKTAATKDYISAVDFQTPALVWFLTGNAEAGRFLKTKMPEIAQMPLNFWLHQSRFPDYAKRGIGSLITANLVSRYAAGLDLARACFSPEEHAELSNVMLKKGVIPLQKFLNDPKRPVNNWHLVIANAVLYACKMLDEPASTARAIDVIEKYTTSAIESDGSYGEGAHYLAYPVGELRKSFMALTGDECRRVMKNSPLKHSAEYLMYPMVFAKLNDRGIKILFRDGQQFTSPVNTAIWLLGVVCGDPVAISFFQAFKSAPKTTFENLMLRARFAEPKFTPGKFRRLPLLRAFDNGEVYLRGSWEPDGDVFALLTGGRNRTGFSHDRAARNGFALAAKGEYFVALPGSSSYIGRIYIDEDTSTRANNGITLNGKNQLLPYPASKYATVGEPSAKLRAAQAGKRCDFIASDAAGSYPKPVTEALRTVVYVRDFGYYVIFDRVAAAPGERLASHFRLNNVDGKAVFTNTGNGAWRLERPRADLEIFSFAAQQFTSEITPGIIHFLASYKPSDPRIGKPGTAIELALLPDRAAGRYDGVTVFFPKNKNDASVVKCDGTGSAVTVVHHGRSDTFELDGTRLTSTVDGQTETVELK